MKKVVSALAALLLIVFPAGLAFSGHADPERDLASSLRSSQLVIEKAQRKRSAGQPIQAEMTQLQQEADGLRAALLLLEERLRVRGQHARELAGKAGQRQEEMEGRYREVLGQLQPLLDELAQGGTSATATLDSLETLFQDIVPAKKTPIFGSLPYSHLNSPALEPATTSLVVPAYRGGSSDVMAADTQGSADAPLTPEIAALAQSLDWNPVRIYEWVQENIATEWYWGAMKGAEETLHQKSGNDADQASLLIAMLRSAGFPARYVRGTIEFFPGIESAQRLTGLDDPLQIAAFLQKAGIPFEPVIAGGKIANFRIEHLWVETFVPYANYRGVVLDEQGKLWIPLDTHLKPSGYQWNDPEDFGGGFNLAAQRDAYLLQPRTETPREYLRSAFNQSLGDNLVATTFQEYLRTRTLVAKPLGILPGSLQFRPTAVTGEYTELPAELRQQLNFTAAGSDGSELFTLTLAAATLSNRAVTLSYEPETVQDQQIIDSYGGLDNTPAYLVRLRPVLKVDGERKVVGRSGLPMGADYTLTIALTSPNDRQEVVSHQVIGNLAALGIVSQQVVPQAALSLEEKDAERLLQEAALAYIERWNAAEEELAAFLKVAIVRPLPTVVTTGGVIDVSYLFDVPHGFDWKGVYIDAGFRRIETVTAPGQEERAREFMRLSALEGSILENRIFEDSFGVASISTAKLLALAPPLLTLDAANVEALLPTLALAENVTADIGNAIHQGFRVTLPAAEVAFKNWSGSGYIKEDPETGEAGYMLSGMIAGGMTAEEWAADYRQYALQAPFGDTPNLDVQAAAHIAKITATDRQNGTVAKAVETPLAVLVTDLKGRPVVGATVTFTVLAGGGNFAASPTVVVQTGATGIARVSPALGVHTADNPFFQLVKQGDFSATQVGVNLFSAAVASRYGDLSLPQPFEIYGRPDLPTALLKTFGDGNSAMVNTPAGTVKVKVVDQHGNPLSNIPVTFTAQAAVSQGSLPLPASTRNIEFYRKEDCAIAFPLPGDCGTVSAFTSVSAHHGAGIETLLGNTLNTRYTVEATASGFPAVAFSLYSLGYKDEGEYSAQIFIEQLISVNEQGVAVNAAKAGDTLATPLSAALFMLFNDFSPEKYSCTKKDAVGNPYPGDCWRLIGSSLINSKRISDGIVRFTPTQGGGSVGPVKNVGGGIYQAPYTTGQQPALNQIEAIGEAIVTVPEVLMDADGSAVQDGYATATLPLRTVTVQTGQKLLFDATSKELWPNTTPDKVTYQNYGVQVPTTVSPAIVPLGDGDQASENLTVTYTIQPQGATPDGYQALSAQIDLFATDKAGTEAWAGYLIGDTTAGTGQAVFSYGTVFDPAKKYYVQSVLNRGSAIEIRGDKVKVQTLAVDLDIDSDNNAGILADGTHNAPSRNPLEEQVEDLIGHPGKVIRPNLLDPDGDKVPGFADGLRKDGVNLFGNEEKSDGQPDSVPFVPLLIEFAGSAFDPAEAKIAFLYPGSDPAQVQKTIDANGETRFTPATGSLRLWSKDGPQSRKTEDIAAAGDYITPGKTYTFTELGVAAVHNGWRLYLEGLTASNGTGDQRIVIQIDPDGDGPLPAIEGDAVRATAPLVGLIPDYNHNREIDDEDRHRAARGDIFYFWINEDDDSGETGGDDIPGEGDADAVNSLVDGVRDLIDFFPVALDFKALVTIFPPTAYNYHLKSAAENLKVVFPELTTGTVANYLVDVDTARGLGEVPTYQIAVSGVFSLTIGQAMMEHPQAKLDRLVSTSATQEVAPVVLFEGVKPGQVPLVLEIADQAGNQVFTTSLNLSLEGVEKMFRHINIIREVGGPPPGDFPAGTRFGGMNSRYVNEGEKPANFPDAETESGKNFVFLHGYNVNGQQARGYQTEMFKRLYWSGMRDKFWGISWYGFESQNAIFTPNYHINVVNAFDAASVLANQLPTLIKDGEITIAAHSLGNAVAASLVSDHYVSDTWPAPIRKVYMIDAAIAMETLDGSIPENVNMYHPKWWNHAGGAAIYDKKLWASKWFELFDDHLDTRITDAREKLTWRNRFSRFADTCNSSINNKPQIDCYNFFSTGEEVLATHEDPGLLWDTDPSYLEGVYPPGRYAIALQERLKGRVDSTWMKILQGVYDKNERERKGVYVAGSPHGGWGFNTYYDQTTDQENPIADMMRMSADEANQLTNSQLKTDPFFRGGTIFDGLLTGAVVSNLDNQRRDKLLSEAIPALTLPAGGPGGGSLGEKTINPENVFNMQNTFKNNGHWPTERGDQQDWLHTDIRKVAYTLIFKLFETLK